MNKKILITGGSGFVGENIIDVLLKKDKKVKIYNLSRHKSVHKEVINLQKDIIKFDLDKIDIEFDYIIHCLALSNDKYCTDLDLATKVNIDFTNKLLEFATKQKKLKKFIHISSIILYDNKNQSPVTEDDSLYIYYNNYSFTKGLSEQYVQYYAEKFKLPIFIFRLANIYGPYQKINNSPFLIPSKINQALTENKISAFSAKPKRDWIYSVDAAKAIVKSLTSNYCGILNLGTGKGTSVLKIIKEIANDLKVNYEFEDRPMTGPQNFYCNIKKTKKILNWSPETSIEDGIKKTIKYIKKYENCHCSMGAKYKRRYTKASPRASL
jgi:nucleoside-diphosphate-sugar epimerase